MEERNLLDRNRKRPGLLVTLHIRFLHIPTRRRPTGVSLHYRVVHLRRANDASSISGNGDTGGRPRLGQSSETMARRASIKTARAACRGGRRHARQ